MWTREDTLLAMALIAIEDDTCQGCGEPLSESMSPDHNPDTGSARYESGLPSRCHACTAIAERAKGYQDEKTHPGALRFGVELVPRGQPPPT